jgi:small subunit ribosomal protein S13
MNLSASEYKYILRIAGKDIDGSKKVIVAVSEIKGIGYNFAQVLTQTLNINPDKRVGFLTESELREIEGAIANPDKAGVPQWYLNRRKNMDTGSNQHMITSDLDFAATNDVEREKLVMSWRGYRHMFGLRVRGQRTRTTGRKGGAVGVKKVALRPGQVAGAPGAHQAQRLRRLARQHRRQPARKAPSLRLARPRQRVQQSRQEAQLQRLAPSLRRRSPQRNRWYRWEILVRQRNYTTGQG